MPRKNRKNVGLIGLGIIGSRAAAALRSAGHHVFVWNRTPKPVANFLGSPAEVAELCEVVQIFVADSKAVFEIIDSLAETLTEKHIVVCSATIGPEATLEAARLVEERGAKFLDAPFTGSRGAAERAQLVYYVGGDESVYARAKPVLEATSKGIVRCGKIGDAATLKVVTNLITAVSVQTLAEALAITRRAGIGPDVFAAAIEHNACRSGAIELKLPKMVTGDYEPHFSLKHMFKDVQLGIHLANSLDLEVPATTVTAGVMYGALNNGWGDLDFASIFQLYEQSMGRLGRAAELAAPSLQETDGEEEVAEAPAPNDELVEAVVALANGESEPVAPPEESVSEIPVNHPAPAPVLGDAVKAKAEEPKADGNGSDAGEPKPGRPFNRAIRRFFSPAGK